LKRIGTLKLADLGLRPYGPALELQERLLAERQAGRRGDTLVLVEHTPVYTFGRNVREEHLLAGREELAAIGAEVFRTGRGGDITYHGPGQLVGYPIIELRRHGLGVVGYVGRLEQVIIGVLAGLGVRAGTDANRRGVWVGSEKVAAIGVKVSRGVTMHGFALNVSVNIEHYRGIVPCGIRDAGVTSLDRLAAGAGMAQVKTRVVEEFVKLFGFEGVEQEKVF
jgi:lipoate-protein ligase B